MTEETAAVPPAALTKREQIHALKAEMAQEQRGAAIELNTVCDELSAKIEALRSKTIPGEVVEQAIDNVLNMTKQVSSWTSHVIGAGDVPPEDAPVI